jgi:hypothetical protein
MDVLNQIVERLSKDELRYLNTIYTADGDNKRKDYVLLNATRKAGDQFNEDVIIKQLGYSVADKNPYYRLKNRVLEDIGDGLSRLYTHKTPLLELLHYTSLFHIYFSKNLYKTCLYYLKKAERIALQIENYELLDNVYDNFIRLSFHLIEINPQPYIAKRKANAQLVSQLRELDNTLADVSYRLKLSQNFGRTDKVLLHRLSETAKGIAAQTTSHFSKSLQTRIYRALSQVLLQQHNYTELETLVANSYQLFEREKWFNKNNHELKLQMLTYCANALYKNKKYKESLQYTQLLGTEIEAYGKLLYDRYLFFFYNLLMVNNAELNPEQALDYLTQFEREMRKKKNYYYDTFIFLNRAGLLYDLGKYKEALKSLVKLYISDQYANADDAFKLKIEISELIITFDSGDTEGLAKRIEQVKKDHQTLLKQKAFTIDAEILQLVSAMLESPNYKRDTAIQKKIKILLKADEKSTAEDSELIKYSGWLVKKAGLPV